MPTVDDVREILKKIYDPEIHLSVWDLGLIYNIAVDSPTDKGSAVRIRMTLTTPACPYGPALLSKVHAEVGAMTGVSEVAVDLAWIPPWDPRTMASDEAKLKMGLFTLDDDEEESPPSASAPTAGKPAAG